MDNFQLHAFDTPGTNQQTCWRRRVDVV